MMILSWWHTWKFKFSWRDLHIRSTKCRSAASRCTIYSALLFKYWKMDYRLRGWWM